ncbi:pilin [Patescibacteria group bacterium]|nr:pilin [Patescibacteria group bacterium]MBU4453252.1 pilin [Patescibacteria group bacterium]MCG2688012.1 pilin [Candidatus Parcubacteria bacterium]
MKRVLIIFSFLTLGFYLFPQVAFATCTCFCETEDGAQEQGVADDITSCQSTCDDFLGCYTDDQKNMYPNYNTQCWTQYECESQPVEYSGGVLASEWDGQASFCTSGEGLCYNEPEPIKLNVAIGSLTQATSLGEYINAVYSWLLIAASFLAIVVMMIGGIEYILARGNPTKITTAKAHLRQAITGIVLLFGSYAIANIVDPHFVTFNRFQPPRIRTIVYLDESSTCEAMINAGLAVTPNPPGYQICGYKGTVTAQGSKQTSVEIGTECTYSMCANLRETCVGSSLTETGYDCIRCIEAVEKGATPSTTMCEQLEYNDLNPSDSFNYFCEYDPGFLDAGVFGAQCVEIVYPEDEYNADDSPTNVLNCDLLRADAEAGDSKSCRFYDNVVVGYEDNTGEVLGIDYNEVDDVEDSDGEFPWLELICDADPCHLAPPNERCEVVSADPDELKYFAAACALPPLFPMTAVLIVPLGLMSLAGDELLANCTNTSSVPYYGLFACKDVNGDDTDCNFSW